MYVKFYVKLTLLIDFYVKIKISLYYAHIAKLDLRFWLKVRKRMEIYENLFQKIDTNFFTLKFKDKKGEITKKGEMMSSLGLGVVELVW